VRPTFARLHQSPKLQHRILARATVKIAGLDVVHRLTFTPLGHLTQQNIAGRVQLGRLDEQPRALLKS